MRRTSPPRIYLVILLLVTACAAGPDYRAGDAVWIDIPVPPWERDFGYATGVVEGTAGKGVRVRIRHVVLPDTAGGDAAGDLAAGASVALPAARVEPFARGRAEYERRLAVVERFDRALARLPAWAGDTGDDGRVADLAAELRRADLGDAADQLELAWYMTRLLHDALARGDPRAPPTAAELAAVAGPDAFADLVGEIERLGLAEPVRRAINSVALEAPWVARRRAERDGGPVYVIHAEARRDHARPEAIAGAGAHAAILGLGRVCQLLPFAHLAGAGTDADRARARIEPILERCFTWVTEGGRRLPAGMDVARAAHIHVEAMMRAR